MKKYFTLCAFALAMLFTTNTFAQEKFNANEIAIKKVEKLKTIMDLDSKQQAKIIAVYEDYENLAHKIKSQTRDGVIHLKRMRSMEEKVENNIQDILNEKQYKIYQEHKKIELSKKM